MLVGHHASRVHNTDTILSTAKYLLTASPGRDQGARICHLALP